MVQLAATTGGSRIFSDGVEVRWAPSTTTNQVTVQVLVGGSLVWSELFIGDGMETVDVAGDTYTVNGSLSTKYQANGIDGQVDGDLTWVVSGNHHLYKGLIGIW
ncbi:MAG TPA: hypothetical protein VEI24_04555 [Nitrospiria bacterium]|nr:hypothetical protein [Nitrospiria bacterium]